MAGSRRAKEHDGGTRPLRSAQRSASWDERMERAPDAESQAAVAWDRLRAAAHRRPDRAAVLFQAASELWERARELEAVA